MKSDAIPLAPVPLTAAQAEAMLHRQIKKHHGAIILLHWFNAIVWLLELSTGVALVSSPHFRVAPDWYIDLFNGLFGTRSILLRFHIALGLTWMIVLLPYALFGFRSYLRAEMLKVTDRDDVRWLVVRTLRILGRSNEPLPPQGIYNAGQKAFSMVVWVMTPVVMLSGLVMAFGLISSAVVGWAVVLHFVAVGMIVAGLVVHVYMGAVFPEEKPAFFSMITGTVNELFAYNHHFKWWREVKLAELAWEQRRRVAEIPSEPKAGDDAPEEPAG
ncbi:MAG: cytochrome b/b6 domain-containing protein [Thermoanaerobaculia bacterium]|nr:cytochrome b/b6 domain-containing protein [Thermoanaerobaculia bacterium]